MALDRTGRSIGTRVKFKPINKSIEAQHGMQHLKYRAVSHGELGLREGDPGSDSVWWFLFPSMGAEEPCANVTL